MTPFWTIALMMTTALLPTVAAAQAPTPTPTPEIMGARADGRIEAIDRTWSGHRVNPAFLMIGEKQIIGYFDAQRQLTLAYRERLSDPWRYHKLPSWVGWDSHNAVALGVDPLGHIHVMANMHADPLVYFRSDAPWDVRTVKQVSGMIGDRFEQRVTYPFFTNDGEGRVIAKFRFGGSGNGIELYHRYDPTNKAWTRMFGGQPLADGEGERNAYFQGPEIEEVDGRFHMSWVWRETPSANTNHDLSYARSRDLVNWENADGQPVALPLKLGANVIVDPVQVGGGLLNGQHRLGFDADKRPMITYFKYDGAGQTQIYLRRKTTTGWQQVQISNWTNSRMDLDRMGSLANEIGISERPRMGDDGTIRVRATRKGEIFEWSLDARTNAITGPRIIADQLPAAVLAEKSKSDMPFQIIRPRGKATGPNANYDWYLTWHALAPNQDIARSDIPEPSYLKLIPVPRALPLSK